MKRAGARALVALIALGVVALAIRQVAPAGADAPQTVVLHVGDRLVVDGAQLGCQVVRRGSKPVIDCRRAGDLKGTYGTMLSERRAMVVRFRSGSTAKIVFTARHNGGTHACGASVERSPCK